MLPEGPGLGVDLDEEALAKRPYKYSSVANRILWPAQKEGDID
jgi:hypothetical protein